MKRFVRMTVIVVIGIAILFLIVSARVVYKPFVDGW